MLILFFEENFLSFILLQLFLIPYKAKTSRVKTDCIVRKNDESG